MPWTPPPGGVEEEQRYTPRSGVRYGTSFRTGRKRSWPRSIAPPLRSPPTRLRLCASSSAGPSAWRARIRSRKPGAKRSTCDSIALGHVDRRAVRDVAVRPRRVLARPERACRRTGSSARAGRTGRPPGRPLQAPHSEAEISSRRAAEVNRPGARALGSRPRDRPVERPVELERAGPVAIREQPTSVRVRQPLAADPGELARRDVGQHDVGLRQRRRRRSRRWISPPSSRRRAASASASRCEPPRGNGQPTAWPSVSSASPKPPLGRRSSGSIE